MSDITKWLEIRRSGDFSSIGEKYGISPMLSRLIINRGVAPEEIPEYLNGSVLHSPHRMKDLDKAAEILAAKIREHRKIRSIGDYDIDGVNATYILVKGIRRCGGDVDAAIPDREKDGYGINEHLIDLAAADGIDCIVTCDNGIAAGEAVRHAKELSMTMIVTDHHDVPYREENGEKHYIVPNADAVVNPKQEDCGYPYPLLCGAVVAWKLIIALYELFSVPSGEADEFYENAAFATVGDVVDLTGENRVIVRNGLMHLRQTKNPGMKALILKSHLSPEDLGAYQIGFILGPCINASGRLDTAKRSLSLLLSGNDGEASACAEELIALNQSRKDMTEKGVRDAKELIERTGLLKDRVLVIFLPNCHESLAGIIAGRIREHYSRPVFVLTKGEDAVKGSGRSIPEYSMFDEMTKVNDLFLKYGGHPMAAGLSLEEKNVTEFARRINECCTLTSEDLSPKIRFDMVLPLKYVTEEFVEELQKMEPFGKGNEKPLFAVRDAEVLSTYVVGNKQNVLKLRLRDQGTEMEAVRFGDPDDLISLISQREREASPARISFVYYPQVNEYRGRRSLQINIKDYR